VDIFGSLALKAVSHNRYQVIDVTGRARVVTGHLPKAANKGLIGARLWGDWVMTHGARGSGDDTTVVFNFRNPSQVHNIDGYAEQLGDGFVLMNSNRVDQTGLICWDFTNGTPQSLVDDADRVNQFATDGSHQVAWANDEQIVVHQLPGFGTTAPLLLGLLAPHTLDNLPTSASWKPQIDATKALGAGDLVIRNAGGATLRTIPVAATTSGSIRTISWNGRAQDGVTPVPTGTYTWELTAPALDGTGNLVVNTLPANVGKPLKGTIKVVSKFIGTVSGPAPRISDTTPVVDQNLNVTAGRWKPVGKVTLSHQWFRGSALVGVLPTYKVAPADLGQRLKVTVTGAADGWRTTTRTSGATAKVVAAH
jgi:hypothetical protein